MTIKPLRTPKDHAAALKEIERLWDKAEMGTPAGDKFEVLSTLVDAYEREHFPIPAPDPIAAIRFRLDQKGLTNKALKPFIGSKFSDVMNKRRRLNLPMIRKLHETLDIPVACLIQDYKLKSKAAGGRARAR